MELTIILTRFPEGVFVVRAFLQKLGVTVIPEISCELAMLFHENTKQTRLLAREYSQHIEWVTRQPYFVRRMAASYKSYPDSEKIFLPRADDSLGVDLEETIRTRRSVR